MYNNTFKDKPRKPLKRTPFNKKPGLPLKGPEERRGNGKPTSAPRRSKMRLKRSRTDTVGKLKKKLWNLCRELIIAKYGSDCYTCPARNLIGSNRHVGHFISSSVCSAALRYSLENLRPQCYACNIHRSGNWPAYEQHLIRDGIDVAALKQRNYDTKGLMYDRLWYQSKIEEYAKILEGLGTQ